MPIQSSAVYVVLVLVKAGGMRIARPRQASGGESKEKTEMTKEEMEEYGSRFVSKCIKIDTSHLVVTVTWFLGNFVPVKCFI